MEIIFITGTIRQSFEIEDDATLETLFGRIDHDLLIERDIYLEGICLGQYEDILGNCSKMSMQLKDHAIGGLSLCHIACVRRNGGWLMPEDNTPWKPGYFGRCPYCGNLNTGMQRGATKFCPHCGKRVY